MVEQSENLGFPLESRELLFVQDHRTDAEGRTKFAWGHEAALLLLWCLDHIETLSFPTDETPLDAIYQCLPSPDGFPGSFVSDACLISGERIADQLDQVYRLHWAAKHDDRTQLNRDVLMEWHHALNWLTNDGQQDWDDVTTDT